ncbi:MAG: glycosyltransferase [Microcoleaceae cyanobacterium]
MPLISVIIPAYNSEKTIRETVESVLKQTFTDFELIVVNDGSTDSTLDILSTIEDPRLKIFSYPNAGSNPTRNRGFSHASGEYIAFLDADDLWTPDKLEAQLKALQENPQAAVAYSWCDRIDESSQFLREGGHFSANGNIYARLLLTNILENGSNPLIGRDAFTKVGGFDESVLAMQDRDLYLRLAAHYSFVAVPRVQLFYRVSTVSLSSNVLKLEFAGLRVIKAAFQEAPESLKYLKPHSFGNFYKYLTYKALMAYPERRKALSASRFLVNAVRNDPVLLRRRIIWKVLFKVGSVTLLPSQVGRALLAKFPKFSDVTTLMALLRYEP